MRGAGRFPAAPARSVGASRPWLRAALLACASLAAACASAAGGPGQEGGEAVRLTGEVVVSGTEGQTLVLLHVEGRPAVGLLGPLLPEISRLSGARIAVEGTPARGLPGEALEVQRYEVLEIDGERPWVGVVVRAPGGYALELQEGVVPLDRPPAALEAEVGGLVWVTGTLAGGALRVQSFGVIRPRQAG